MTSCPVRPTPGEPIVSRPILCTTTGCLVAPLLLVLVQLSYQVKLWIVFVGAGCKLGPLVLSCSSQSSLSCQYPPVDAPADSKPLYAVASRLAMTHCHAMRAIGGFAIGLFNPASPRHAGTTILCGGAKLCRKRTHVSLTGKTGSLLLNPTACKL